MDEALRNGFEDGCHMQENELKLGMKFFQMVQFRGV